MSHPRTNKMNVIVIYLLFCGSVGVSALSENFGLSKQMLAGLAALGPVAPTHSAEDSAAGTPLVRTASAPVDDGRGASFFIDYSGLPLSFEANRGQFDPRVRFVSRGRGYTLFLTDTEVLTVLRRAKRRTDQRRIPDLSHRRLPWPSADRFDQAVLTMKLLGSHPRPKTEGLEKLPGISNYFIGNDPSKWHTNVPNYAKVRLRGVYPGVDVIYYGSRGRLEYDFLVHPGGDPNKIQVAFEGADEISLDADGDLVLHTPLGEIRWKRPVVYQMRGGVSHPLDGRYVLKERARVAFQLSPYDHEIPLVIDPVLEYSTYIGGTASDNEYFGGIAVNDSGSVYVTGDTYSADFPTIDPMQENHGGDLDAFVAKLNPTGSAILSSTFLGGGGGDQGISIGLDEHGNVYVAGSTGSPDFPTVNALQPSHGGNFDAFVVKLSSTGSALLYSTFFGGRSRDAAFDLAVDANGNVQIAGLTESPSFPMFNALQPSYGGGQSDAFAAKLDTVHSSLLYSTFFGGRGADECWGLDVDGSGNTYLAGLTDSSDFPTMNPFQPNLAGYEDAFVAKLNPAGSVLLYSTYFGGGGTDRGFDIAVDTFGNAHLTGLTASTVSFPTLNALQQDNGGYVDSFIVKLNSLGTALTYSTFLGGSEFDRGLALAVDASGNVHVAGNTASTDFPTVNVLQEKYGGGETDAFVARLDPTGSTLIYSTYLGGRGAESAYDIAVDAAEAAHVIGGTNSLDFPTTAASQPQYGGEGDAWVAKISTPLPTPAFSDLGVVNAASYIGGPVAPCEIITIFGSAMGLPTLTTMELTPDGKYVTKSLADTRVLFDGIPAPLIFVSASQLSAVTPISLAGKESTQVQVEFEGRLSEPVSLPVVQATPGIFTIPPIGRGQGAILNWPDYSVNGLSNPASKGSIIMVFATSGGLTDPPSEDGQLVTGAPQLELPVAATIGGITASVLYAGAGPTLVNGVLQVNILIPENAPSGAAVPLFLTVGGAQSQQGVTVAIQ